MIKSVFAFLGIIYYSSSCCVKICNQNGIYFKVCGDDLDLNIDNIHCDNLYKNVFWENEYLMEAKGYDDTILRNATNLQNANNLRAEVLRYLSFWKLFLLSFVICLTGVFVFL